MTSINYLQGESTDIAENDSKLERNGLERSEEESCCHSRKIPQEEHRPEQILIQEIPASVFAKGNRVSSEYHVQERARSLTAQA